MLSLCGLRHGILAANATASTSDFVAVFHGLYTQKVPLADDAVCAPVFKQEVPLEIQLKLQNWSLEFAELPPLLQHALLWDSGYSVGDDGSLAQIHTLCGLAMDAIGITRAEFATTTCATEGCVAAAATEESREGMTTGGDLVWSQSRVCRADQLVAATKCSCTAVDAESTSALWTDAAAIAASTAVSGTAVFPHIRIRRQRWVDPDRNQSVHVYAIHTGNNVGGDVGGQQCAPTASLVIPCVPHQRMDARWCRPRSSPLMDAWLQDFADSFHAARKQALDAAATAERNQSAVRAVKDSNGVTLNPSFTFDGTTSDLAQQFYRRHIAGDVYVAPMVVDGPLPGEVLQRLAEVSLEFDELPPLLQRALVWDAGYAYGDGNSLAAVYAPCGRSMAEIALSRRSYNLAGCAERNCSNAQTGANFARSEQCTGDQLAAASLCATTDVSTPAHVAVWAEGGQETLVPDVNIVRHTWEDRNRSYLIYGIHMVREEVAFGKCPTHGAMVIPCLPYEAVASTNQWCRPKPGALVTSWLRFAAKDKQFNLLVLVPILLSVALGVTGLTFCIRRKSWKRVNLKEPQLSQTTLGSTTTPQPHIGADCADFERGTLPHAYAFAASLTTRSSIESFAAMSSNSVLHALVNNPLLANKRIDFADLRFRRMIAKGAHGEVWLCAYEGTPVAVKRLLRTRKNRYDDLEAFTTEIALTAAMHHPNMLRFIGVAWNTLQSLCMVTEYMANGDLQQYLRRQEGEMSWTAEKLRIAVGIARALDYLHAREPATIHRDLKSKNVLLSADLQAKLIDFGVSRNKIGEMMTTGVGTPYWTAPEILQGHVYSEKADVYSFGVVICELDTGTAPYNELKTAAGQPEWSPLQILQLVVTGALRPALSPHCPMAVAELARTCLHDDPAVRPSAAQALATLQSCVIVVTEDADAAAQQSNFSQRTCRRSIAFSL